MSYRKAKTLECGHQLLNIPFHGDVNEWKCSLPCDVRVEPCGHSCSRTCHVNDDPDHITYKCGKICERVPRGCSSKTHKCQQLCHEKCPRCQVIVKRELPNCNHMQDVKCSSKTKVIYICRKKCERVSQGCSTETHKCQKLCHEMCPPCQVIVKKKLPNCSHMQDVKCSASSKEIYKCRKKCKRVPQGCSSKTHKCQKLCHEMCPPCQVIVKKKLPNCSHMQEIQCSAGVDDIVCTKPCNKKITTCGHDCKLLCYEPCGDGSCDEMIKKTIQSCGHEVLTECNKSASIRDCFGDCTKVLPCGHPCKKKCNEVCTKKCYELVEHTESVFCGHKYKIECHLQTQQLPNYSDSFLQFCKEPCTAVLDCSHKCSGTCDECAQGRIHLMCMEKTIVSLICGHECTIPCGEMVQPCQMKCNLKCVHSKCSKLCSEECTKCQEPCARQCKHMQCTAKCGVTCTVPPCQEHCEKKLPCLHPCMGFCGDPCPPLCRICNSVELTEIFQGFEDENDARFVLLDECKHVIESQGIETFYEQEGGYRKCPKCRTPLRSTQRYSDYFKEIKKDVVVGNSESFQGIQAKLKKLRQKLNNIKDFSYNQENSEVSLTSKSFDAFVKECTSLLSPVNKNERRTSNLMICKTLQAKLTIAQNIQNELLQFKYSYKSDVLLEMNAYVEYLFKRLTRQVDRITDQEIKDFKREQDRLKRIVQFLNIVYRLLREKVKHREIRELIYKPIIYTKNYDKIVELWLTEYEERLKSKKVAKSYMKELSSLVQKLDTFVIARHLQTDFINDPLASDVATGGASGARHQGPSLKGTRKKINFYYLQKLLSKYNHNQ